MMPGLLLEGGIQLETPGGAPSASGEPGPLVTGDARDRANAENGTAVVVVVVVVVVGGFVGRVLPNG